MARLKLKWNKSQSSKFARCGASGIYNFSYYVNEQTMYSVTALQDCYELSINIGEMNNKTKKVLGHFETSIQAKRYAEALI